MLEGRRRCRTHDKRVWKVDKCDKRDVRLVMRLEMGFCD